MADDARDAVQQLGDWFLEHPRATQLWNDVEAMDALEHLGDNEADSTRNLRILNKYVDQLSILVHELTSQTKDTTDVSGNTSDRRTASDGGLS